MRKDNGINLGLPRPTASIEVVNDESLQEFAKDIENRRIACIDQSVSFASLLHSNGRGIVITFIVFLVIFMKLSHYFFIL